MPPRRTSKQQPTVAAALAAAAPRAGKDAAAVPARGLAGAVPPTTPEAIERRLREFDLDSRFGPCVAISRRRRWERAEALGLCPPRDVLALLDAADPPAQQWSLWHGRPPPPAGGLGSGPATPAAAPRAAPGAAALPPSDDGAGPSTAAQGPRKRRKPGEQPRSTKELNTTFTKRKAGLAAAAAVLASTTEARTFVFVASRTGASWAYASPGFAADGALLAALRRAADGDGAGAGVTKLMDGRGKVVAESRGGGGEPRADADAGDDDLDDGETLAELDEGAAAAPAPAAPPDAAWLLSGGASD